ncbi:conjugal transfer protein TraG, partial [Salmonella enterica subsp. enterica serovar Shubra]|nr:conjugal transfer protein TraG [Salmonella enterica subsp. enterica serovar Shubra]
SVGPAAGMQSDLKKEHAESVAGMEQRASGAAVKTSEQIQNQVRDARQTVESQVLKNEQEVASSKKALGTERDALSEQYKDSEKAFDEALVQERQKQKPLPLSPSGAWNSDKDEENMQRLRDAAKWKDK